MIGCRCKRVKKKMKKVGRGEVGEGWIVNVGKNNKNRFIGVIGIIVNKVNKKYNWNLLMNKK